MIIRTAIGQYQRKSGKTKSIQRQDDDFDLAFGSHRIYILDAHEWLDPHTSAKYDSDGRSRHAMQGPSFIRVTQGGTDGRETHETYVNDPSAWAWIRRCIAGGYLTAETLDAGLNDEKDIHINDPRTPA